MYKSELGAPPQLGGLNPRAGLVQPFWARAPCRSPTRPLCLQQTREVASPFDHLFGPSEPSIFQNRVRPLDTRVLGVPLYHIKLPRPTIQRRAIARSRHNGKGLRNNRCAFGLCGRAGSVPDRHQLRERRPSALTRLGPFPRPWLALLVIVRSPWCRFYAALPTSSSHYCPGGTLSGSLPFLPLNQPRRTPHHDEDRSFRWRGQAARC